MATQEEIERQRELNRLKTEALDLEKKQAKLNHKNK